MASGDAILCGTHKTASEFLVAHFVRHVSPIANDLIRIPKYQASHSRDLTPAEPPHEPVPISKAHLPFSLRGPLFNSARVLVPVGVLYSDGTIEGAALDHVVWLFKRTGNPVALTGSQHDHALKFVVNKISLIDFTRIRIALLYDFCYSSKSVTLTRTPNTLVRDLVINSDHPLPVHLLPLLPEAHKAKAVLVDTPTPSLKQPVSPVPFIKRAVTTLEPRSPPMRLLEHRMELTEVPA